MVVDGHDARIAGVMMVPVDTIRAARMRVSLKVATRLEPHRLDDVAVLVGPAVPAIGPRATRVRMDKVIARLCHVKMRRPAHVQVDRHQRLKWHDQREKPNDCGTNDQKHLWKDTHYPPYRPVGGNGADRIEDRRARDGELRPARRSAPGEPGDAYNQKLP